MLRLRMLAPVAASFALILVASLARTRADESQPEPKPDAPAKGLDGLWEGTLKIPNTTLELRLAFKFEKADEGSFKGTMDSIDEGLKNLRLTELTFKDGEVALAFKPTQLTYAGKLAEDGNAIKGTFKQRGVSLPLDLKRVTQFSTVVRPQEPKKPYPYREEEVLYENTAAKVKLAGTLTLPAGIGPFPCVLLITGSGAQDRDESLLGHKPFLVLADHLTRQGIAVLRVDDRGVGKSTGNPATSTSLDFVDDVLTGVEYLKNRPEIDPFKIGLIGHSEGGLIAPIAASRSKDVAFIVLLAGTGLPGRDILDMQSRLIAKLSGSPDAIIEWNAGIQKRIYAIAEAEKDDAVAREKVRAALKEELANLKPELRPLVIAALAGGTAGDDKKDANAKADPKADPKKGNDAKSGDDAKKGTAKPGTDASTKDSDTSPKPDAKTVEERALAALEQSAAPALSPWFRFFVSFDPRDTLAKVTCPVLAINGEKDLQVPPKENLREIENALKRGGNADVTVKELPGLNHLFQTAKTGLPAEYARIEETFSPIALALIAEWIKERTK